MYAYSKFMKIFCIFKANTLLLLYFFHLDPQSVIFACGVRSRLFVHYAYPINPAPFIEKTILLIEQVPSFQKNSFLGFWYSFFCKSFDQYHIVILIHLFNHSIWCSRLWPHSSVLPWLSLNFHINYRISLISKNKPRWDFHCQYRLIWRTDIFQYCLPIMNMVYPSYWGLFCYISDTFNGITNGNVLSFIF